MSQVQCVKKNPQCDPCYTLLTTTTKNTTMPLHAELRQPAEELRLNGEAHKKEEYEKEAALLQVVEEEERKEAERKHQEEEEKHPKVHEVLRAEQAL